MDFISRCFRTDVAERFTCEEALEHPWLTEKQSSKGIRPCNASFINSLSCFKKKRSHLQEDLLEMLISCQYLSKDQVDTLKKTFTRMDKNKDGVINQMELQMSLRAIDPDITEQEAQSIMLAIDVNKDGSLDYHEVLEARINRKLLSREARLRKLFCQMDQDGDNALTCTELRDALNHVEGSPYTIGAVKKMMVEVDRDHDGVVEYEEFIDMWAGRKMTQNGGPADGDLSGRRLSIPVDMPQGNWAERKKLAEFEGSAPDDDGAAFRNSYGPDTNPTFGTKTINVAGTDIVTGNNATLVSVQPSVKEQGVEREESLRDIQDDPFQLLEPLQDEVPPAQGSPPAQSKSPTATVSTISTGGTTPKTAGSGPME